MSRHRTFFHRTTAEAARAIVGGGFRDGTGTYGFIVDEPLSGVWLSADGPVDENEGARGDTVLSVKLTLARRAGPRYQPRRAGAHRAEDHDRPAGDPAVAASR